jgi:hypothetical protein
MAVLQVIEYKRDSSNKLKQDGSYLVPTNEHTRYFQVLVDDPATPHSEIYAHADIPRLYEPHPDDDGVICKGIVPKQGDDDESYVFDVTVEYNDDYSGEDPDEPEDGNPLNRPVVIRGGFAEYDQVMVVDVNGGLIRNKAKDYFDPPVTRKGGAMRFSMTKNYASLNLPFLKQYKNAINSDTWFGQAPETVRIANITFDRSVESWKVDDTTTIKVVIWQHTFEFELAEDSIGDGTWRKYVLNQGFKHLVGGLLLPLYDIDGNRISEPKLLTAAGAVETNPDNANYIAFDVYRQLPFAALGLL